MKVSVAMTLHRSPGNANGSFECHPTIRGAGRVTPLEPIQEVNSSIMLIYEDYSYPIPFWGVSCTALETLNTTRHINQTIPFRSFPLLATRGELAARSIFAGP